MIIQRLAERNGLSEEKAEERIASQMSAEARVAKCHVPMSSAFGMEDLRSQLASALADATERASMTLPSCEPNTPAGTFHKLCKEIGVSRSLQHKWWGKIRDHYSSAGRYYHDLTHVSKMLKRVDAWNTKGLLSNPIVVGFSVLFHDVIYDAKNGGGGKNEIQSAELFREFAADVNAPGLPPADIDAVAKYIERTMKHHDGPATGDLAYFLDADLQVFGFPPAKYAEYTKQCRLEYAHMPGFGPNGFPKGRLAVMKNFLEKEVIYYGALAEECDVQARKNLADEIKRLERRVAASEP